MAPTRRRENRGDDLSPGGEEASFRRECYSVDSERSSNIELPRTLLIRTSGWVLQQFVDRSTDSDLRIKPNGVLLV